MYSVQSLHNQMEINHIFKIASFQKIYCGFASFSQIDDFGVYKIHKLYLLQKYQGLGLGKIFLTAIENELLNLGATTVHLNVNRENKAQYFYLKQGYQILKTVDIPYHNFMLNDFVMYKPL